MAAHWKTPITLDGDRAKLSVVFVSPHGVSAEVEEFHRRAKGLAEFCGASYQRGSGMTTSMGDSRQKAVAIFHGDHAATAARCLSDSFDCPIPKRLRI